ncbi:MAG TPA: GatB/YqeY domain-containing protein [Cytophagaceae bacterium]|jgi:uncharacterized protein YqeY|nr:GatB/YqeY domain-containing protein [Cytophagaceae bacterium]
MSLKVQIDADIKKAMIAKNQPELLALRAIKSLILLAETEKGAKEELTADAEMKLLAKASKQRKESAEVFAQQGRKDLEEKELLELSVVERYMPKQLSEEEVKVKLQAIISNVGATSAADLGKVMGVATKELAGQADGKLISALVRSLLS